MIHFKQLKIWLKGIDIAVKTYILTGTFPREEKFGLSLQLKKAAISIPSNIAEGSSRTSKKDYCRYIEIALGSAFELETQLLISKSINCGHVDLITDILKDLYEEQKMLLAFARKLQTSTATSS